MISRFEPFLGLRRCHLRMTGLIGTALVSCAATVPVVHLSPQQTKALAIRTARAEPAADMPVAIVPATVQPPLGARRAVAAPFAGIVRQIYVVQGQKVRAGQPLAVVMSREVLQTGAELARARARAQLAGSTAARTAALARAGVIAEARSEEANSAAYEARTVATENARILALGGADGRSGTYTLRAPIAGTVSSIAIQAGGTLDGMAAPFVIDASGQYALTAQLPERYAGQVRTGMRIAVAPNVSGKIVAVGTTVDPATRSLSIGATIPGGPGIVLGRALSATVLAPPPAGAVQVPAGAVTSYKGRWFVFVVTPRGYVPREVRIAGRNAQRAVIASGLDRGETVATTGVTELKSLVTKR
ncbi:efflux RND transporter periplasmic adaptor subunit [Sphingomonas sp. PAMC 26621]|uniref:efflux RND transporter periplasmic adaptor subunit n=1 Tax=Sphingomonas sp. PAMC 26621 TaxID=1112213 RepID=UPI0002F38B76|nr:efflux RND transporter periplasmic adaptor subunit [Sphingomonas sp. PAMC 26621]